MELSVLIPARNEEFLDQTIQDVLKNSEAKTEVIVILDGYIPNPSLTSDERVTLIYNPIAKGQRAATNQAAKIARGKYLMKLDAHCALDKGFDRKMLEAFGQTGDNVTMIPVMRNLHAFDWICPDGHRSYQGKSTLCQTCGKEAVSKDVHWTPKQSPARFTFTFDKTMHFQYWGELAKRPENIAGGQLRETLSIQGSCFMLTKERYFALDICSETDFHSWGQQGVEVACKTWLSGGRVIANLNTWYAHMFRTNNFGGFPYSNPQSLIDVNREKSRELFQRNGWPHAIHTFEWLLEKFNPPDWGTITKGIIYYSDNETKEEIATLVKNQLIEISKNKDIPIVTACLKKKADFGVKNIYFPSLKIRGVLSQSKQILGALENSTADIIYFCEADVLYHESHFDFTPEDPNTYYYNVNVWKVRWQDGHSLKVDDLKQLSGLVGYRQNLIRHYRRKIEIIEQRQKDILALGQELHNEGVSKYMGYEPGMHSEPRGVDNNPVESFRSQYPIIDIRHDNNLTKNRWTKEEFKDQQYTAGWTESTLDKIEGWNLRVINPVSVNTSKGIIFYTDSQLDRKIALPIQINLSKIALIKDLPIVNASLKAMNFGTKNIHFPSLERGYYAMHQQILSALENSKAEVIFFTEHDVLYHPSHFDFVPEDKETFYYNQNVWYLRQDGHALHYDVNQLSGLCVYRQTAIAHYRERLARIEKEGFTRNMGFEPFTHNRVQWEKPFKSATWMSKHPNIDIRFGVNSTGMRWKKEEYRNQQLLINWEETDTAIPGWFGTTLDLVKLFS